MYIQGFKSTLFSKTVSLNIENNSCDINSLFLLTLLHEEGVTRGEGYTVGVPQGLNTKIHNNKTFYKLHVHNKDCQ